MTSVCLNSNKLGLSQLTRLSQATQHENQDLLVGSEQIYHVLTRVVVESPMENGSRMCIHGNC